MILDANTGAILHSEAGDELRHPASLTKMMTLYLTFEGLEAGRLTMASRVPISRAAANAAPSKLDLEPGDDIAVGDAIRALITKSANDVAVALAEKTGGTEAGFVKLMNAKAHEIGMTKTHFENASGLPDPEQVTTARDMITLALHLQDDFPAYYPLFALREFRYGSKSFRNHNTMLNNFAGIDGIKTGYTQMSGFNLVSSVHRGNKHLIGAVFGGASAATRNGEMRVLLTRALTTASGIKTRKPMLVAKLKTEPRLANRPAPKLKAAAAIVKAKAPEQRVALKQSLGDESMPAGAAKVQFVEANIGPAPIEIFKVRRNVVENRKPVPPAVPADQTTDMAEPSSIEDVLKASEQAAAVENQSDANGESEAAPKLALAEIGPARPRIMKAGLVTLANGPAGATETIIPKRPGRAPSTFNDQVASLEPGFAPSQATPPPGPVEMTSPQPLASAEPDSQTRPLTIAGDLPLQPFDIQIGAYPSLEEAKRMLASAREAGGQFLDGTIPVTQPIDVHGRKLVRARFRNLSNAAAQGACGELRRAKFACMVVTSN